MTTKVNHGLIPDVNPQLATSADDVAHHSSAMVTPAESPLGIRIRKRLRALSDDEENDDERSQAWLAGQCGVTPQAVAKWIKSGKISWQNAHLASQALVCSMEWLLFETGIEPDAYEIARDWRDLDDTLKARWRHTIKAAADAAREARKEIEPASRKKGKP